MADPMNSNVATTLQNRPPCIGSPPTSPKPSPSFAQYGANARVPSASNRVKRELARNTSSTLSTSTSSPSQTAVVSAQPLLQSARAVFLNVYDITAPDDPDLIPRINSALLPLGIGLFHSGVEVYGVEYAFGGHYDDLSGIFTCQPKHADGVTFRCSVPLGDTLLSEKTVHALVEVLGQSRFMGNAYSLIGNNCNSFSEVFVSLLNTPKSFPTWVNRMASIASSVSCILPESVEQPLSELAPTAANLERKRTSITGPPSQPQVQTDDKRRMRSSDKTSKCTEKRGRNSSSSLSRSSCSQTSSAQGSKPASKTVTGSYVRAVETGPKPDTKTHPDSKMTRFEAHLTRPVSETSTVSDNSLSGAIIDENISDVLSPASSYCESAAHAAQRAAVPRQACNAVPESRCGVYEPCHVAVKPTRDSLADMYRASPRMCFSPKSPSPPPRIASLNIPARNLS